MFRSYWADLTYGKSDRIISRPREPEDPDEHALVVRAITSGLSDCVEWRDETLVSDIRRNPDMGRIRPQHIKADLLEAVCENPNEVVQVLETRPNHVEKHRYYYKVILCYHEVPHDVFVEIILNDPDPDLPAVSIVSVHPQRRI